MAMKVSGLVDTHQAAQILSCNPKYVRDLIRGKVSGKKLPAFKVGREYKLKREDVIKFLESCRVDEENFYE
ncbi:MAG: helix-turn-helix domain-containing protein [Deltaproteobacteria bacterium]|nr:helix-turn-helix domain-containing protein [Deltaproteobacteria bacterium]